VTIQSPDLSHEDDDDGDETFTTCQPLNTITSLMPLPHLGMETHRLYEYEQRAKAQGGFGAIYVGKRRSSGSSSTHRHADDVVLKTINVHACALKKFRYLTTTGIDEIKKYITR